MAVSWTSPQAVSLAESSNSPPFIRQGPPTFTLSHSCTTCRKIPFPQSRLEILRHSRSLSSKRIVRPSKVDLIQFRTRLPSAEKEPPHTVRKARRHTNVEHLRGSLVTSLPAMEVLKPECGVRHTEHQHCIGTSTERTKYPSRATRHQLTPSLDRDVLLPKVGMAPNTSDFNVCLPRRAPARAALSLYDVAGVVSVHYRFLPV